MDWGKLREALAAAGAEPKEVSESTTEPTKSKVFDSYNTAEHPEGGQSVRKRNRAVDKDKLEMTKECLECEKRIKDVKKAVPCNCKLALFCSNTCLEMSDHFAGCKGITFQDPPSSLRDQPPHETEVSPRRRPRGVEKAGRGWQPRGGLSDWLLPLDEN